MKLRADSLENRSTIQLDRGSRLQQIRSRVFCLTLLGIAFTFTVILTNVFIDIDGLLFNKNKADANLETVHTEVEDVLATNLMPGGDAYDYKEYGDSYEMERTKRSLDAQEFSFHIKDPNIKKVITTRVAALLEDLDREESYKPSENEESSVKNKLEDPGKNGKYKEIIIKNAQKEKTLDTSYIPKDVELMYSSKKSKEIDAIEKMDNIEIIKKTNDVQQKSDTNDELRHLAMHNIILQGIIGHMDLADVYARVHALINDLETTDVNKDKLRETGHPAHEKQLFNELVNCKQLKEQIIAKTAARPMLTIPQTTEKEDIRPTGKPTGRNVMIKTIIDITSLTNEKNNQDDASSKENVNGIIKLIYNGKTLKFRRVDTTTVKSKVLRTADEKSTDALKMGSNIENINYSDGKFLSTEKNPVTYVPNIYMNKIISEYLKRYSKESESLEHTNNLTTKRQKRHIKIQYENEETTNTETEKPSPKKKEADDELFLEIETHFDSKGLRGEQKKKMIRDLIDKIQKAIHADKEEKNKKHKHLHVKKRTQHPLDSEHAAPTTKKPIYNLVHRELDPISKSVSIHAQLPYVSDNKGDNWRRYNNGPRFLTVSKAINSAEMNELDTDYNKVMNNGIPERLQKPLNSDSNDKPLNYNLGDSGNVKYIVKDIAGSGFSIGFNQYVDESPDAESMNMFTGIENIIKTYHQKFDEEGTDEAIAENMNQENDTNKEYPRYQENPTNPENAAYQEYSSHEPDGHSIVRRSIRNFKQDKSNEYSKVILSKNFLKYDNYQDIYNRKGSSSIVQNSKIKKNINPKLVIDENILNKDLKPSEIFSLADLLRRKKRSLKVKKISNIKNYKKLSRYLNTQSMASKKIFQQNKRSKRQINKIRIIAKDLSNHHKHNSEENIFVLSDEKIFADRAVVKEVETPDIELSEKINEEQFDSITPQQVSHNHYDIISPQKENNYDFIVPQKVTENHYDIISPYVDTPSIEASNANNVFTRRSRHNSLMSKYPHIFMEEISRSKEDFIPDSPLMYENGNRMDKFPVNVDVTTQGVPNVGKMQYMPEQTFKNSNIQDIINQYPPQENGNYKVTVKIMPKNSTGLNSGFKEIHSSINKSYNKNGLVYTSLVNVSEISKVEKINQTKESDQLGHPTVNKIKNEQLKMKSMIQQHKDRIEEQLAHLNKEKEKLQRIDSKNAEFIKDITQDYIDVPLAMNPARTLHITKEDLARLLNIEEVTTTQSPPTTMITTAKYVEPATEHLENNKLINTIERNEKITNEILKKIDKNTDILQTFLDKLISKMYAPRQDTRKTTHNPEEYYKNPEPVDKTNNFEQSRPSDNNEDIPKIPNPKVQKTNDIYDQIPNLFFNHISKDAYKNGSAGIPFIYAFQQPYMMADSKNKNVPIANVVYQGHIHAHTINKMLEPANKQKLLNEKDVAKKKPEWKSDNTKPDGKNINNFEVKNTNSTRFFIDDLESDYKVLPIVGNTMYPVNLVNATKP